MLSGQPNKTETNGITVVSRRNAVSVRASERLLFLIGGGLFANALIGALLMNDILLAVWGINLFIWTMLLRLWLTQGRAWAWWLILLLSVLLFASGTINLGSGVLRLVSGLPLPWTPFVANLLYIIFLPLLITNLLKRDTRLAVGIAKRL